MGKFADQHGPVLGGVRVLVRLLSDELTQPRLLGEPFACEAAYRMPAHQDRPWGRVGRGLRDGYHIRSGTQADGMLQGKLAFVVGFLSGSMVSDQITSDQGRDQVSRKGCVYSSIVLVDEQRMVQRKGAGKVGLWIQVKRTGTGPTCSSSPREASRLLRRPRS